MKKITASALAIVLALTTLFALASCQSQTTIKIAVPNDATNEARALNLLAAQGIITLKDDAGETPTARDIKDNPYNVEIVEVEAAQVPSYLKDVAFAVINSNYAIEAGLSPFATEGTDVSYPNIISVKAGNENTDTTKALIAAINSKAVQDYINDTYKGVIVCDLKNPSDDGIDSSVDYEALSGSTITIAASPTPHAGILNVAKTILASKNITLDIQEYTDYNIPNDVVESGEVYANFFQHVPYMEYYNSENGTHLVSVLEVHHEPMGVYAGTLENFDAIKK